ncbi:hypothetical protein B0H16DRAFT_1478699 [Mycena metata]|uniref:Uncharacterized protein n=1 Tax=Mycena metata TaxID=1033252 RepID=A0AAD7MEZ1_9AGAR|nr:hypothetical protein B0H16DRAFT_1478699 [Mycena metata]
MYNRGDCYIWNITSEEKQGLLKFLSTPALVISAVGSGIKFRLARSELLNQGDKWEWCFNAPASGLGADLRSQGEERRHLIQSSETVARKQRDPQSIGVRAKLYMILWLRNLNQGNNYCDLDASLLEARGQRGTGDSTLNGGQISTEVRNHIFAPHTTPGSKADEPWMPQLSRQCISHSKNTVFRVISSHDVFEHKTNAIGVLKLIFLNGAGRGNARQYRVNSAAVRVSAAAHARQCAALPRQYCARRSIPQHVQ